MIKKENYPNAYKEVYVILQNIDKKDYDLIPERFIKMLENNMNSTYNFELNSNEDFENKELLQETKTILTYLYVNYWGTEDEKVRIKQKFKQDIIKEEEEKRKKYNPDKLFEKEEIQKKQLIVEAEKESVFIKLVSRIKNFLKKINSQ